jgi:hypothetical protein
MQATRPILHSHSVLETTLCLQDIIWLPSPSPYQIVQQDQLETKATLTKLLRMAVNI